MHSVSLPLLVLPSAQLASPFSYGVRGRLCAGKKKKMSKQNTKIEWKLS